MANQNESSNDGLMLAIFIFVAGAAIWYFFGRQIGAGFVFVKRIELAVITYTGMGFFFPTKWAVHVAPAIEILSAAPRAYTQEQLGIIGTGIGYFFRWYVAAAVLAIGWQVLKKNPLQRFRTMHNMRSLAISEQRLWPSIAPVARLDLISMPIDSGPWAMSRRPVDFAKHYKLLDEENKLIRPRAEKLFAAQLGKLWEGPNQLPLYAKALFAAFAAQAAGDLDGAKRGLNTLSMSMAEEKPDYSWVDKLLAQHLESDKVKRVLSRHAYVYTVMAGLLKEARSFGVCASAQFIWLRPKNRMLWYMLNGVGRRVAFAEVGGIYAHYISEEVAGKGIERPFVIKAVDGLERAILEVKFDEPGA